MNTDGHGLEKSEERGAKSESRFGVAAQERAMDTWATRPKTLHRSSPLAPRSSLLLHLCLSALLCASFLTACTDTPKISDEDVKELQYKPLRDMMENQKKGSTYLLDPRIERHYAEAHIPGAVHIPIRELVAAHPALAKAHNIVVYGTTFTDGVAVAAAKKLMAMGYKNVFLFRGGVELWRAEGGRVESSGPAETRPAGE